MADELEKGTVKWFNNAKGFGFIEHTSGRDVFVHYSAIETEGFRTLKDGEEVLYEIQEGPKGLHALRVQRPSAPLTGDAMSAESGTSNSEEQSAQDGSNTEVASVEAPQAEVENEPNEEGVH